MAIEKGAGEFQIDFPATQTIIDSNAVGKKGVPMHYQAYNVEPPMKTVPVENGIPKTEHPGMTLAEYAAAKRWEYEVSGITFNNIRVATDDRSKMLISGAREAALKDENFKTKWKSQNGEFIELSSIDIIEISDLVLSHISNCFELESIIISKIENGEIENYQDIDNFFPKNQEV